MMDVSEVMDLLKIGRSKAYSLIQALNQELEMEGYLTINGKIPKKYLLKRFHLEGGMNDEI